MRARALVVALAAVVLAIAAPHPAGVTAAGAGAAPILHHHQRRAQQLAIAFDDGPTVVTSRLLDSLAATPIRAAFFVSGRNIAGREELLRRAVAEGHEIGNHAWSHRALDELGVAEVHLEIEATRDAIAIATGVAPTAFRPPFVRWNEPILAIARELGHDQVFVEPSFGDYRLSAARTVAAASEITGTIWLHDGIEPTPRALPEILRGLT